MIFDLYFELDFNSAFRQQGEKVNFQSREIYHDIKGDQHITEFKGGYCTTLNRRVFENCFSRQADELLWIFGYVYTNAQYESLKGHSPKEINAKSIFDLRQAYPNDWYKYIKGSYVIIIYNENTKRLEAYTDYLNVLPLYYSYDGERLAISSNTSLLLEQKWVDKTTNNLAICMQHLFDYMLGEHYFVKGIKRMENARCYHFSPANKSVDIHWDVSQLKHEKLLQRDQSLDLLAKQLKKNVNLYTSYAQPVSVSLTGGFDGRTNVAMIDLASEQFKCYSYGMPGSKQIEVPKKIADHININYTPIYLDSTFLDQYSSLSQRASYFSNGTAPIGFANKVFAYTQLQNYSDTIITGLFGSEILRPIHNNRIQVNDQSYAIFLNKDIRKGIQEAIANRSNLTFTDIKLEAFEDELLNYFQQNYFEKYSSYDPVTRFFFFIIQEGLRKYFSQELSIERVYVTTKYPYFDMDIVNLIYQTPWAGMYNGFLGESKVKRRKGQLLYAHIMKKYMPKIMEVEMDRGYKPSALLDPFPINYIKLALGVYRAKKYMKKHKGNDTFKTKDWAHNTLLSICQEKEDILNFYNLNSKQLSYTKKNADKGYFLTFRYFASLKFFLSQIRSSKTV